MERNSLEASSSPYLKDDRLVIECHITVIREPWVVESSSTAATSAGVEAPRRSLLQDFSKLLETMSAQNQESWPNRAHTRGKSCYTPKASPRGERLPPLLCWFNSPPTQPMWD